MKDFEMVCSGKKNRIGSLHGPRNNPWLNGTCPALVCGLPGCNSNSDVQLPYRFPLTTATHHKSCTHNCTELETKKHTVRAAQRSQNAQAGYAADYQCKRCARSFNEIKEFMKGHRSIAEQIKDERSGYVGFRHARRILSDYYGKSVVRSQQESANLRLYSKAEDVTAAETIKTSAVATMPGRQLLQLYEQHTGDDEDVDIQSVQQESQVIKTKIFRERHCSIKSKNIPYIYAYRPAEGSEQGRLVWNLSIYEFVMYWRLQEPRYVKKVEDLNHEDNPELFHATLTVSGVAKLPRSVEGVMPELRPGVDYVVKDSGTESWMPLPKIPQLEMVRHRWVLMRNSRPITPTFRGCPMPSQGVAHGSAQARNAKLILAYFAPFTLRADMQTKNVPYLPHMRGPDQTWMEVLETWLEGRVATEESAKYVNNFINVTQIRPDDDGEEQKHDEDIFSDEDLEAHSLKLADLLRTSGGAETGMDKRGDEAGDGDEPNQRSEAFESAEQTWKTDAAPPDELHKPDAGPSWSPNFDNLRQAIRKSRAQTNDGPNGTASRTAKVAVTHKGSMQAVQGWLKARREKAKSKIRAH